MSESVTIKIPGKLFIAGEYAVARPQGEALIAAVETDFVISVSESSGNSRLETNVNLPTLDFDINNFEIPDNGWNFALCALRNLLQGQNRAGLTLKKYPQLTIKINSELGYGENKKGYGSSASVVVGIVKAVNQFMKLKIDKSKAFEYAAKAHFEIQGSGSMGDVASILSGGIIYYQSPDVNWQNWKIENSELYHPQWQAYIVMTGKSVKTGDKLKINLTEKFYETSDEIVNKIKALNQKKYFEQKKFQLFKKLILANQSLLADTLPEGYVTEKLAFALNIINRQENLVGKISGSGFGENIIVFAKNEKGIKKVTGQLARKGISIEKIRIADEQW
ncbi:mevalonate kinase family protein [Lactococcus fujiensis]|uniref:mevalonate kinase family protein n=1 Tax=Lactococcus fujiensis TaxID=610251 RepID=UPI000BDE9F43|nr:phosphomevalonate kinase [Lactococcus fujiensis]